MRIGASDFFGVGIKEGGLLGCVERLEIGAKLGAAEKFDDGTLAFEFVDVNRFPDVELSGERAKPAPILFGRVSVELRGERNETRGPARIARRFKNVDVAGIIGVTRHLNGEESAGTKLAQECRGAIRRGREASEGRHSKK